MADKYESEEKKVVRQKVADLVAEAQAHLKAAEKLADEHGLTFSVDPEIVRGWKNVDPRALSDEERELVDELLERAYEDDEMGSKFPKITAKMREKYSERVVDAAKMLFDAGYTTYDEWSDNDDSWNSSARARLLMIVRGR